MEVRTKNAWTFAGAGALTLAAACSGGGSSPSPAPSPSHGATITIANNAVSPATITVDRGSQVTFVNNDSRTHDMNSDPHPEHTDCPALAQVGVLNPGQSHESGNLTIARTCGYHDHNQPETKSLQGKIIIQ